MYLSIITFILFGVFVSNEGQFMGGMLYIRPTETHDMVTVRSSWKMSSADKYTCDASTDSSLNFINVKGSLIFKGGCNDKSVTSIPLKCTDYSTINNWWSGTYSETYLNSCNAPFIEITFKGDPWHQSQNGGGTFVLYLKADLENRPNSDVVNSFPMTVMPPITTLLYGCKQVITFPVFDKDADIIRCRMSKTDECGGVCATLPWMTLNEKECSLEYFPNMASPGIYALAIQVEDFIKEDDVHPRSSIPVQFLIEIIQQNVTCEHIPTADDLKSTLDETVVKISSDSSFNSRITAKSTENAPKKKKKRFIFL